MTPMYRLAIIGPLGPAQLACLRSWHAAGHATTFFHVGSRPLPSLLRGIADHYRHFVGSMDLGDMLSGALDDCARWHIDGITALSEHLALKMCERASQSTMARLELLLNSPMTYEQLESKLRQCDLASRAGLPVLNTIAIDPTAPPALDFHRPWVLRPDIAHQVRPLFKAELIESGAAMDRFLKTITTCDSPIVAQPFVSGPNMIIHGARARDGTWDHHEAFITEIKASGLAVSVRPYPLPTALLASCRRFEEDVGLRGVFHYDFVIDEQSGQASFLEVNPRLGGTTAKVYAAGYDEPAMLVSAFKDPSRPDSLLRARRTPATSRIAATRCALAAMLQRPTALDYPSNGRAAIAGLALKGILSYSDEVLTLTDPVGNLAYVSQAGT